MGVEATPLDPRVHGEYDDLDQLFEEWGERILPRYAEEYGKIHEFAYGLMNEKRSNTVPRGMMAGLTRVLSRLTHEEMRNQEAANRYDSSIRQVRHWSTRVREEAEVDLSFKYSHTGVTEKIYAAVRRHPRVNKSLINEIDDAQRISIYGGRRDDMASLQLPGRKGNPVVWYHKEDEETAREMADVLALDPVFDTYGTLLDQGVELAKWFERLLADDARRAGLYVDVLDFLTTTPTETEVKVYMAEHEAIGNEKSPLWKKLEQASQEWENVLELYSDIETVEKEGKAHYTI